MSLVLPMHTTRMVLPNGSLESSPKRKEKKIGLSSRRRTGPGEFWEEATIRMDTSPPSIHLTKCYTHKGSLSQGKMPKARLSAAANSAQDPSSTVQCLMSTRNGMHISPVYHRWQTKSLRPIHLASNERKCVSRRSRITNDHST